MQTAEGPRVTAATILKAVESLPAAQPLNRQVHAVHGAAWCGLDGSIRLLREDVGRHNALDKLIGAMARAGADPSSGFAVVTSRASYEMAMKAASAGITLLAAVSAPTALAITLAEQANLTLVGFARADGYAVYSHGARIDG